MKSEEREEKRRNVKTLKLSTIKPSTFLVIALVAVLSIMSGCTTPTHKEAKAQAHQRWRHVRANIKQRLAEQQHAAGHFEDSARTAAEAISLDPKFASSYELLARCYIELGKITSATRTLRMAAHNGVESPKMHYTRGIVLEDQGRSEEALAAYARALELEPGNLDFLVALAECLATSGRTGEALELLDDEAQLLDDDGTVALLRAHIAALEGNEGEAISLLRNVRRKNPGNHLARAELGRLLARTGQCAEALRVLDPLIREPNTGRVTGSGAPGPGGTVRRAMATCYLRLNDFAPAKAVLASYAESHPTDAPAQLLLAKAALGSYDMLTAMRAIDLAGRHGGDRSASHRHTQLAGFHRSEVRLVRAAIRWKRGRFDAAAADLRSVIASDPTDVQAHCLLGEVLSAQRKPDAARTQFRLARQLEPGSAWAALGLASIERAAKIRPPVVLPPQ